MIKFHHKTFQLDTRRKKTIKDIGRDSDTKQTISSPKQMAANS